MSVQPSSNDTTQLPPRGACVNEECTYDGICAGWAVIVNGIPRLNPLHTREPCGACGHAWLAHSVEDIELEFSRNAIQRRGCPRSQCGGFCTSKSGNPSTWTFDTLCDCGVELRAHLPPYAPHRPYGLGPAHTPWSAGTGNQNGPVTSHGHSLPAPPGLAAPAPTTFAGTSAELAATSPVAAYGGLRAADPGSTNDRRVASYQRIGTMSSGDFALNQPRTRTSTTPSSVAPGTSPTVSSPASGSTLILHEVPSGPPTAELVLHLFPVKHPADKTRGGVWPRNGLEFSDEDYVTVLERCTDFHLVFCVVVPLNGPVWMHLHSAVIDHCRRHGLVFVGYDDSLPPTGPTKLPFILLSSNTKSDQPVKKYSINDSLNVTTFTAKSLRHKRFAGEGCPLPGALAGKQMLRIVPRYGDVHAHLERPSLSGVPGLHDYHNIICRGETHPCFPARVLTGLHPHLQAECRPDCPQPAAHVAAPALGPLAPVALADSDLEDSHDHLPFTLEAFEPAVPTSLFLPSTPVTVGDAVLPHTDSHQPNDSNALAPAGDLQVGVPASAVVPLPTSPVTPRQRRRHPRPGHMTTGSRRPRTRSRTAAGVDEDNNGEEDDGNKENTIPETPPAAAASSSSLGVRGREDDRQFRPSNRRRMFSPVARDESETSAVVNVSQAGVAPDEGIAAVGDVAAQNADAGGNVAADEELGEPLKKLTWRQFVAWTERVTDTIPLEVEPMPMPKIRAPDVDSAARILIFLVRWLIRHKSDPSRGLDEAQFRDALFAEVRIRGFVCELTTLEQLLRHADGFEVKAGHGIGRSVLEVVLRCAVNMLLEDTLCFQDMDRFKVFRWLLDGRWSDPRRLETMSVLGFLSMMCMIGRYGSPHPLSPIALRHAIEGRNKACSMDMAFLRLLDQGLYEQFRPWALHDPASPIAPTDYALKGLIMGGGMDPGNIGIPSADAWASMERSIFSTATLGAPDIDEFVDFKAFVAGMSVCIPGGDLDKLFEYRCRDYLALLCNQQLSDPQVVLDHLEFERSDADSDLPVDRSFEIVFADRVREHLLGVGHPNLPRIRELVGEQAFSAKKHDRLLRARLFLQMMTGADLVPMNPSFFTFTHKGDRAEVPRGAPVPWPSALNVQSCFAECAVTMDPGLRNLLRERSPYQAFQSWFHGALVLPNTFNQV